MKNVIEKQFDKIAQEMDAAASAVRCTSAEYLEGLEIIQTMLDVAKDAAREDIRRANQAGDD